MKPEPWWQVGFYQANYVTHFLSFKREETEKEIGAKSEVFEKRKSLLVKEKAKKKGLENI